MNQKSWQRFTIVPLAALGVLCGGVLFVRAHPGMDHSESHEKPGSAAASTTLTGEVLDLSCYMAESAASGKDHQKCAKSCLVGGGPAGLLLSDGSVVVLVEDHAKPKAYKQLGQFGGETVKITGTSATKGGLKALAVDSVEKSK